MIGVTSNDNIYTEIYGYKFIPKESLCKYDYDFIIVTARDSLFYDIQKEALQYGAKKNRVFKCNFLEFFNLDVERYIGLKDNPPTIFRIIAGADLHTIV